MKRAMLVTAALSMALPDFARGGSVIWNVGTLELHEHGPIVSSDRKTYSFSITGFEKGTPQHPDIWVQSTLFFDCGIGYLDHRGGSFLAVISDPSASADGNWAIVEEGRNSNFDSTLGSTELFFRDYHSESEFGDPIFMPMDGNPSLFLAFALPNMNPSAAGSDTIPDTIYGWVEFNVGDILSVSKVQSAMDLSGRPLAVGQVPGGQVPEPTTGGLALVGVALLIPRRRRG